MSTQDLPRSFYLAMRLHQLVLECLEESLVPTGLTATQYTVLSMVHRYAPITSAELARRLRISAQSAGESVKVLESKGTLARHGIEENKRVLVLKLTVQGRRTLARASQLVADAEERFFSVLSPQERAQFEASIATIRSTVAT